MKSRRPAGPKIAAVVAIIFAAFLIINFFRANKEDRALESEIKKREAEAEEINKKNEELLAQKKQFESEEFLEREARVKLGFRKEGERVVVIERTSSSGRGATGGAAGESNPERWWRYFFGT